MEPLTNYGLTYAKRTEVYTNNNPLLYALAHAKLIAAGNYRRHKRIVIPPSLKLLIYQEFFQKIGRFGAERPYHLARSKIKQ